VKRRLLRLLERAHLLGPAFRGWEAWRTLRGGRRVAVDGPPLPPRRLMVRVAGTADGDWFVRGGRAAYDAIVSHVRLDEVESVLDFGCGCGRVIRWWDAFPGTVAGSDGTIAYDAGAYVKLLRKAVLAVLAPLGVTAEQIERKE